MRLAQPRLAALGAAVAGLVGGLVLDGLSAGPALAGSVRVGSGQTLSGLAQQLGTTTGALAAANGIGNPSRVYAGEVLHVPTVATVTVRRGDTLTSIAARYHTTTTALATANGIADHNRILTGTTLSVPAPSPATGSAAGSSSTAGGGLPPQLLAHPDRLALRPVFARAAATYGVPAGLLEGLCWWESGWQSGIVSATRAVGVCQIEPYTANFVNQVLLPGKGVDVHTADGNITAGAAFLHSLLQHTGGNEAVAVAGYYQGLQSVQRRGMLPTTRQYVKGILAYAAIFASAA